MAGLLLLLAGSEGSIASAWAEESPRSPFVEVGRTVRPAVVNIRITRSVNAGGVDETPLQEMFRQFFPDAEGRGGRFENPGTGSGFVVAPSGDILTNHHVVAGADRIFVRFSRERREYEARLVGSDPSTDLALIRIDPAGRDLPSLSFGDSEQLEVGDWAIAVGNPFGNLEGTMTVGIVSGQGRGDLVIQGLTPRYQDFIQTDASINFGNSGGPLVDIHGRVIGVNTAINSQGQGIGFAVPSRIVKRIYDQLNEHGRVIRGFLGVKTTDVARADEEGAPGAQVVEVVPGSPAERAGILAGDLILRLGAAAIGSPRELDFAVAEAPVGEAVPVDVVREGRTLGVDATLEELGPTHLAATATRNWLGLEVASLAEPQPKVDRLRETLGIEAVDGVIVVAVEPRSAGADAGVRVGDVLVSIDGQTMQDMPAYERARDALRGRPDPLTVMVRTGNRERYVEITPREAGSLQ